MKKEELSVVSVQSRLHQLMLLLVEYMLAERAETLPLNLLLRNADDSCCGDIAGSGLTTFDAVSDIGVVHCLL